MITTYQCIVLFIDIKIFDQSITQKIIERTNTILEGFSFFVKWIINKTNGSRKYKMCIANPQFFHMMLFDP
jgi:hypothetical protein